MLNPIRRDRKFRDWINPLEVYGDLGLFQRFCFFVFCFPRCELREVIDEFNDGLQYLASTKGSISTLVLAVLVCVSLYFVL